MGERERTREREKERGSERERERERAAAVLHRRVMGLVGRTERLLTYLRVAGEVARKGEGMAMTWQWVGMRVAAAKIRDAALALRDLPSPSPSPSSSPSLSSSLSSSIFRLPRVFSFFSAKYFSSASFRRAAALWPSLMADVIKLAVVVAQEAADVIALFGRILWKEDAFGVKEAAPSLSLTRLRASL